MGLVDYSDSEGSDAEVPRSAPRAGIALAKPGFQKVINRNEPKKIRVDLPTIKPEPGAQDADAEGEQRATKRARIGGAFGGFNSLLPAPKGRVQSGPKAGVSLKTSSEAAFSRAPVDTPSAIETPAAAELDGDEGTQIGDAKNEEKPKIVGKATKFRPLSVANNKKKKPLKKPKPPEESSLNGAGRAAPAKNPAPATDATPTPTIDEIPAPKPKRSLFSVHIEEPEAEEPPNGNDYSSSIATDSYADTNTRTTTTQTQPTDPQPSDPNSLHSIASDLNLTPAQRRQLFGRHAKDADINIAHFNMDSEYADNEQARRAGEVVEHRAVKSIAPGKHSLQQLVNNARTQQGGLEDKWAEGRRERGEAGGKYGWGK